jgi:5-methylcytosine-specific restriction endonuclease McrA
MSIKARAYCSFLRILDYQMQHPFSGRKGSAQRDQFATTLYAQQDGCCRMCQKPIPASLRGRSGKRAAVIDHIIPWRMRPDLSYELSNLQLICRGCHPICESIEDQNWGNADLIREAKARAGQDW